jgi:Ubiquitin family
MRATQLQVGELKDRLVELTGVLHERQRLLFAGHALQDDQRLRERGVRDGHTIHLVERLEGANAGPPPPPPGGTPSFTPACIAYDIMSPEHTSACCHAHRTRHADMHTTQVLQCRGSNRPVPLAV